MSPELWARIQAVTDEHDDVALTDQERISFWSLAQRAGSNDD